MYLKDNCGFYSAEKIDLACVSDYHALIDAGEDYYHSQVENFVIGASNASLVMLAGPSASGKTTTAYKIRDEFIKHGRDSVVVSLDDFYKDKDYLPVINGYANPEVVNAIDTELVHDKVLELITSGEVMLPEYDFATQHGNHNAKYASLSKGGTVIVEGIHGLNKVITSKFDSSIMYNVYVSPHTGFSKHGDEIISKRQMRQIRRLVRDHLFRSSDACHTFSMWPAVCQAEDMYIRPSVKYADFIIDSTHAYEPCIFYGLAHEVLEAVPSKDEYYGTSMRLLSALSEFTPIDIKELPSNSMLHEFVG